MSSKRRRHPRIYMIAGEGAPDVVTDLVKRALASDVDCVQLRRKNDTPRAVEMLVHRLLSEIPALGPRLMVNGRVDIALSVGARGVHLPTDGLPVAELRRVVPSNFWIGCSVHDEAGAVQKADAGADFLVFGPIFPTRSKPGHPGVGLSVLERVARQTPVPVLALGGVTPPRVADVARAGAAGVAGISAFEDDETLKAVVAAARSAWES